LDKLPRVAFRHSDELKVQNAASVR